MKRALICIFVYLCVAMPEVWSQRVVVGGELSRTLSREGVEWLTDRPSTRGKALLVEFFHTTNVACMEHVDVLNEWAGELAEWLNVVVVTREPSEQVAPILMHEYQYSYVAIDEGGVLFNLYEVPYVPYAVLIDPKGEVLWVGNGAALSKENIKKLLQL